MSNRAAHVAGILRGVAEEAIDGMDRMTWRAALLAAARIVEEDDNRRIAEAPVPTDERDVRLTDAEWAEFQAIPDQGYSHRDWLDKRFAAKYGAEAPAPTDAEANAARGYDCPRCDGSGHVTAADMPDGSTRGSRCPRCDGTGHDPAPTDARGRAEARP